MSAPANRPAMPLLVGRDRELRVLREHLSAALAGHGSLVLIGGEAGIGKTALAEAVCREATEQGALVLTGRCFDLTETPAYGPWLYLFDRYQPHDALPARPPVFAERGFVGEVGSQAALFRQVLTFLEALAAQGPLILLVDDLHWSDPASLDLLRFLAQSVGTLPLLILVTYRSDELTRRHPLYALLPVLVREASAARLDLHALDGTEVRTLVMGRYHLLGDNAARLVAYLQARAEGNAFFVGELLRTLEESGALYQNDAGWHLAALTQTMVPPLLRQVIDGRVARLDDESQRLLAVAAVIGHEVPLDLWAQIGGVDEDTLVAVIEQSVDARLLVESARATQFAHALVREALYEGILATRRRRVHRRVAEVLSAMRAPDPDAVAYHFQQAGDARAIGWLITAGTRALELFADRAAAPLLETALGLLDAHEPDSAERGWVLNFAAAAYRFSDPTRAMSYATEALRGAGEAGDRVLTHYVLRFRGWLYNDAGQMRAGLDDLLASRALLEMFTDAEKTAARERPFPLLSGPLFDAALAEYLAICGEFARARELGERVAIVLENPESGVAALSTRTLMALGNCHFGLLIAYMQLGESEKAKEAAAKARSYYQRADWGWMVRNTCRMECLRARIYAADRPEEWRRLAEEWDARYADTTSAAAERTPRPGRALVSAAEGQWDEARAITASLPDDIPLSHRQAARLVVAGLDHACGEREAAWEAVRAVLPEGPTAETVQNHILHGPTLRLGAELALDEGDLPTAVTWLGAYDALLARSGAILGQSEGHALWCRYFQKAVDRAQSRMHAEQALARASEPRQPLALLTAHRLLGEMDTDIGAYDDAARHLDAALSLADACQMPYERALTLLAMAELRASSGDVPKAKATLEEVRAICGPLGAKPALARADALTARLSLTEPARSPIYPAGLTAREVEVLRLVAAGMMNSEIAARLFLSERTIEQHLRSIYNKLGSSSRTAATRFAVEHHFA